MPEVADPAVVARPRVRVLLGGERAEEPLAHPPVVRLELREPERLPLAEAVLHVDVLDGRLLDPRDLLGVEAELQDVRRLGGSGELRVDRLVPAVLPALEEVGEPAPAAVREIGLIDDLRRGGPDRLLRQPSRLRRVEALVVVRRDADDRPSGRLETGEVRLLVLVPLPEDEIAVRGVEVRLLELAARDGQRQRRQVRAGEMGRQVGRREGQRVVENAHTMSIGTPAEAPYGGGGLTPPRGVRPAATCLAWLDRNARGDLDDPSRRPGTPARLHHAPRTRLSRRRHERPGRRAGADHDPRDGDPQHRRERHDGDVREGGRRPGDRRAERELRVRARRARSRCSCTSTCTTRSQAGARELHRPGDALRGPEHELPERRRGARHRGHGSTRPRR